MDEILLETIRQLSTQLREACEEYAKETKNQFFRKFPMYCCGYASEMLECFLIEKGIRNLRHVIGVKPYTRASHAWTKLENGLIIDITLDQFSESNPSVYIGKPLPIHNEFCERRERESDSEICNFEVGCFYSSILCIINASSEKQNEAKSLQADVASRYEP